MRNESASYNFTMTMEKGWYNSLCRNDSDCLPEYHLRCLDDHCLCLLGYTPDYMHGCQTEMTGVVTVWLIRLLVTASTLGVFLLIFYLMFRKSNEESGQDEGLLEEGGEEDGTHIHWTDPPPSYQDVEQPPPSYQEIMEKFSHLTDWAIRKISRESSRNEEDDSEGSRKTSSSSRKSSLDFRISRKSSRESRYSQTSSAHSESRVSRKSSGESRYSQSSSAVSESRVPRFSRSISEVIDPRISRFSRSNSEVSEPIIPRLSRTNSETNSQNYIKSEIESYKKDTEGIKSSKNYSSSMRKTSLDFRISRKPSRESRYSQSNSAVNKSISDPRISKFSRSISEVSESRNPRLTKTNSEANNRNYIGSDNCDVWNA